MSPAETLEAYCAAANEPTEVPTPEVHTHPHSTTTHNTHLRNTHNMTADSVLVDCISVIKVPDSSPSGTVGAREYAAGGAAGRRRRDDAHDASGDDARDASARGKSLACHRHDGDGDGH